MTRYISLGEYFWLAEQVTGVSADAVSHAARIELADSALHAPRRPGSAATSSFRAARQGGSAGLPPQLEPPLARRQQAGCLGVSGHVLDLNDVHWNPDQPQVDEAESAMLAIAAAQVDEDWVADWLRSRARFPTPDAPPE